MSSPIDITYIRDNVKLYCDDYINKLKDDDKDSIMNCKIQTGKGTKKTDGVCFFSEVPKIFLDIINENNRLMILKQEADMDELRKDFQIQLKEKDETISDLREDFQLQIREKDKTISDLHTEARAKANELDALAQYIRRDNLKIEGIEYTEGEDINTIVKEIAKAAGLGEDDLKDSDISIGHRIGINKNAIQQVSSTATPVGLSSNQQKKPPSILLRLNWRDIKIKLFEARKNLQSNPNCPAKYKSAAIYEDVTPLRSRIMYELRNRDERKMFKYVWS